MKTYMTNNDVTDLYFEMSKKNMLKKNGSAFQRWKELKTRQKIREINSSKHTSKALKKALIDQL